MSDDPRAEVARVLSEHMWEYDEHHLCSCGWVPSNWITEAHAWDACEVHPAIDVGVAEFHAHVTDALLPLIERARESGRSNGYIAGFEAGDARARKVLGGAS